MEDYWSIREELDDAREFAVERATQFLKGMPLTTILSMLPVLAKYSRVPYEGIEDAPDFHVVPFARPEKKAPPAKRAVRRKTPKGSV